MVTTRDHQCFKHINDRSDLQRKLAVLCNPAHTNSLTKTNKHVQPRPKSSPTKTSPVYPPEHAQLVSTHSIIIRVGNNDNSVSYNKKLKNRLFFLYFPLLQVWHCENEKDDKSGSYSIINSHCWLQLWEGVMDFRLSQPTHTGDIHNI